MKHKIISVGWASQTADISGQIAALKKAADANVGYPPERIICPPLTRDPVPESKVHTDPKFCAWNAVHHLDQTVGERRLGFKVWLRLERSRRFGNGWTNAKQRRDLRRQGLREWGLKAANKGEGE